MPLLDRNGWKADDYVRADAYFAVPALLVPVEALDGALTARLAGQLLGVELSNSYRAPDLLPVQDRLDLVAVEFPKFNDGRGFSIARLLREQGYKGTLRATGAIIPDLFVFALQCGFDEVEIDDAQAARQPIEQWLHALTQIGARYQDGEDGVDSILKRRRAAA